MVQIKSVTMKASKIHPLISRGVKYIHVTSSDSYQMNVVCRK